MAQAQQQEKWPPRMVRVHDFVWTAAQGKARSEGRDLKAMLVEFLEAYAGVETPVEPQQQRGRRVA